MSNSTYLSPLQLHRELASCKYRSIHSTTKKIFAIRRDHSLKWQTVVGENIISKGAWFRGVKAEKEGRDVGVDGHPLTINARQLEIIENQVLVKLSEKETIKVHDVQNMCADILEKECGENKEPKKLNEKYAYKLLKRSEIIHAAVSRPIELSKIAAQSPENVRQCESTSKLVVCLKKQITPASTAPPKVPNSTLCLCVCADGSSLQRFLLWPMKSLPQEFSSLSAFDIKVLPSSSGWITKEIFKNIMINFWIPAIVSKVKPTSTHKALLLMDNHGTHSDNSVADFAEKHNIILKCFPPNMTHLLQPCDSCIFSRLKTTLYNKFHVPVPFSIHSYRSSLADTLPEAVAAAVMPSTIKAAFIKTGVWPVAAAPVLDRISGSPIQNHKFNSDTSESSQDWREELFGNYSPHSDKQLSSLQSSKHSSLHDSEITKERSTFIDDHSINSTIKFSTDENSTEEKSLEEAKEMDDSELMKQIESTKEHLHFLQKQLTKTRKPTSSSSEMKRKNKHSRQELNEMLNKEPATEKKLSRKNAKRMIEILKDDEKEVKSTSKNENRDFDHPHREISPSFNSKEKRIRETYYSKFNCRTKL
ncbi:putative DDE superfamily endonuclease [Monocercomonoides exilis]|uniref:putative DDE superfamily endonuclease n=1 Tax=Monocercomonoides exilis TaxID=2049356 RepID=UPI0035599799|nr:putative DDE superfamily endonuclease [Monocercomonoides exilis]|eukprot:MONOS_4394.1-p1 / transcript=MONOS_4394.1 / gene=MONOS_4394 / organism=Monocercomonoides_exilis_PA203 / gene_product=unspecified product / transcript_product=unspecified product / location=Mono_scaffold00116:110503-112406(-) / protein_length=589 / sequence_SO=supercontig / SO=protein_coding / is_pseudo=false